MTLPLRGEIFLFLRVGFLGNFWVCGSGVLPTMMRWWHGREAGGCGLAGRWGAGGVFSGKRAFFSVGGSPMPPAGAPILSAGGGDAASGGGPILLASGPMLPKGGRCCQQRRRFCQGGLRCCRRGTDFPGENSDGVLSFSDAARQSNSPTWTRRGIAEAEGVSERVVSGSLQLPPFAQEPLEAGDEED